MKWLSSLRRFRIWSLLLLAGFATAAGAQQFTEFSLPNPSSGPDRICLGPDGALWFTEYAGNRIGRITTDGRISEFPIPTPLSSPIGITVGPDRNLWFAESHGNNIGRINPDGLLTEFPIPTAQSSPWGISAGPDGALWFTETVGQKIGRITIGGMITEFPLAPFSSPAGITSGPDGLLWFTKSFSSESGNALASLSTDGALVEFPIPTPRSQPLEVTVGPDGNVWFTEFGGNRIGRLGPDGTIAEFPIPTADSEPEGITGGPDRNLWFVENGSRILVDGPRPPGADSQPNSLGRITTDGATTEFQIPTPASLPTGITTGPDDALWFTESGANKIGRFLPPPGPPRPRETRRLAFRAPPPALDLTGKYLLSEDYSCGGHSESEIFATQTGDQFGFLFGVDTGGVSGTIRGNTIDFDWVEGVFFCPNRLSGTGTIVGTTIRGVVFGGGCRCDPLVIAFTLTPE